MNHYRRVAAAIDFIRQQHDKQPKLDDIAKAVHLSPRHLHRLFREWAGITPKEFLQYTSLERIRNLLDEQLSIPEAAFRAGLSSTSRLHDLFVKIEAMTPGEYRSGGKNLDICYDYGSSPFGEILIAATDRGICALHFADLRAGALEELGSSWPNATYRNRRTPQIEKAIAFFSRAWERPESFKLHLRGTPFQLKTWEALLKIPPGRVATYTDIARSTGNPGATRAVGSAIGKNPVSILIPCHRIIRKSGEIGNYYWGPTRKCALLAWEAAKSKN